MIHDAQALFSDTQALTVQAASTNTIDLGIARDIGTGEPLYVFVAVKVVFTDAGSDTTLTVTLQGGTTAGGTSASRDLFTIPAVTAAGFMGYARLSPAGMTTAQILNTGDPLAYRFIRLLYTPNNGNLTTGTVSAGIVHDVQQAPSYATGISIV